MSPRGDHYVKPVQQLHRTIFKCDTRFIYQVQSMLNYARMFQLKYIVPFLGTRLSDIACDINSSAFIWKANISTCCYYIIIARLFLKKNYVLMFINHKSMRTKHSNDEQELGLEHLDDATLFAAIGKEENFLFLTADKQMNNNSLSSSFLFQSFYHFCTKMNWPCTTTSTPRLRVSRPSIARSSFLSAVFSILHGKTQNPA